MNLFVNESEWLIYFHQMSGSTMKDLIANGASEEIIDYASLMNVRTGGLFPVYMYGGFVILLFAPIATFSLNSEINSNISKIKVLYYGKYSYCLCKSIAIALLTGVQFMIMGISTTLLILVLRERLFSNPMLREIYVAAQEYNLHAIPQQLLLVMFFVIFVGIGSFFAIALGYATEIPYVGLLLPFFTLFNWQVGPLYSIRDTMSYLYLQILPTNTMCGYAIPLSAGSNALTMTINYYLWLLLIVGGGVILMRAKKQHII